MVNTSGNPRTLAAPVAGANSYTRGEAEARMNAKGFVQVSNLRQDERGIWRGAAMKDGHRVEVALDYQGNVVAD